MSECDSTVVASPEGLRPQKKEYLGLNQNAIYVLPIGYLDPLPYIEARALSMLALERRATTQAMTPDGPNTPEECTWSIDPRTSNARMRPLRVAGRPDVRGPCTSKLMGRTLKVVSQRKVAPVKPKMSRRWPLWNDDPNPDVQP